VNTKNRYQPSVLDLAFEMVLAFEMELGCNGDEAEENNSQDKG